MAELVPLTDEPEFRLGPSTSRVCIQQNELVAMHRLFYSDPSIAAAQSSLERALLGGGISVSKGKYVATKELRDTINHKWQRFARDVLWHMVVYGFAICDVSEDKTPFVREPMDHRITIIKRPNGTKAWRISKSADESFLGGSFLHNDCLLNVRVWQRHAPDFEGRLTSRLRSLQKPTQFVNLLVECAAKAELRRSVPPIITETPTVSSLLEKTINRDMHVFGDHSELVENIRSENNRASVYGAYESETRNRAAYSSDVANSTAVPANGFDPVTGAPKYPVNIDGLPFYNVRIALEPGTKLVTNTVSEAPASLLPMMEMLEADVGKVLGVPPGLWGSQRRAVAVDQTVLHVFRQTVQDFRELLQRVFEVAYYDIYAQEEADHLSAEMEKERERKRKEKEKSSSKAQKSSKKSSPGVRKLKAGGKNNSNSKEYGNTGLINASTHDDDDDGDSEDIVPDIAEMLKNNRVSFAFYGTLDDATIQDFQDRGYMEWHNVIELLSRSHGIDPQLFAPEQVEVATGKPLRKVVEDQREFERHIDQKKMQSANEISPVAAAFKASTNGAFRENRMSSDKSSRPKGAKRKSDQLGSG